MESILRNRLIFRNFFAVALLYGSTLVWFYLFHGYLLEEILPSQERSIVILGKLLFYGSIVIFGIIGSILAERIERRKFLIAWVIIGVLSTISLITPHSSFIVLFQSLFLGLSFGLGFPSCQLFLARYAKIENRGRLSGLVISTSFLFLVLLLLIAEPSVLNFGLTGLIWACVFLKLVSLVALSLYPFKIENPAKRQTWTNVLISSTFLAYLVPWLVFQICNGIFLFMQLPFDPAPVENLAFMLEFLGVLCGAFVSGFLADYFGRKQPILIGLLFLGSSYALLGLVTGQPSWLLANVAGGLAWGLIAVSYMQVVLGDMSIKSGAEEKTFALGGIAIPMLIYTIFAVVRAEFSNYSISASLLSSLLSILIFACVVPILRAKETGPDLRERRLKEHLKKVGKIIEDSAEQEQ